MLVIKNGKRIKNIKEYRKIIFVDAFRSISHHSIPLF